MKRVQPMTQEEKQRKTLARLVESGEVVPFFNRSTGETIYFSPDQAATLNLAEYAPLN